MFFRTLTVLAFLVFNLASAADAAKISYNISQATTDAANHFNPSINDLGQVGWCVAQGPVYESYSTVLRERVLNRSACVAAAGLNLKELVWTQVVDGYSQVFSDRRGQRTFDLKDHEQLSINDAGEVVWIEKIGGYWQVVSSIHGPITTDPVDHFQPHINNVGTVVWSQNVGSYAQIFKAMPQLW